MQYSKTRRPPETHRWGFATTIGKLTSVAGHPVKAVPGYNEAMVLSFKKIGTWIHYPTVGTCYKMTRNNLEAELERRHLTSLGLQFALRESVVLPQPSFHPPHCPIFDQDLPMTMDRSYHMDNEEEDYD